MYCISGIAFEKCQGKVPSISARLSAYTFSLTSFHIVSDRKKLFIAMMQLIFSDRSLYSHDPSIDIIRRNYTLNTCGFGSGLIILIFNLIS